MRPSSREWFRSWFALFELEEPELTVVVVGVVLVAVVVAAELEVEVLVPCRVLRE